MFRKLLNEYHSLRQWNTIQQWIVILVRFWRRRWTTVFMETTISTVEMTYTLIPLTYHTYEEYLFSCTVWCLLVVSLVSTSWKVTDAWIYPKNNQSALYFTFKYSLYFSNTAGHLLWQRIYFKTSFQIDMIYWFYLLWMLALFIEIDHTSSYPCVSRDKCDIHQIKRAYRSLDTQLLSIGRDTKTLY